LFSYDENGQRHLIECASKTLNDAERKWITMEKEAYAIVWALKHWACYLRGRHILVYTDHKNLQWDFAKNKGKLQRWAMQMSEFYLEIRHKSGRLMCHVDCLSRNPHEDMIEDRMVLRISFPEYNEIQIQRVEGTRAFPSLEELRKECQREGTPEGTVLTSEGVYLYEGRVLLPNRYKHMILHQYHGHVSVGHPGETRTLKGIQKIFKWPQMRRDVQNWIKSCLRCSRVKTGRERLQGLRRVNPIQDPF